MLSQPIAIEDSHPRKRYTKDSERHELATTTTRLEPAATAGTASTDTSDTRRWREAQIQLRQFLRGEHWVSRCAVPMLLLADALLCSIVISTVAYTEIDWRAYIEQVEQVIAGERNYTRIKGGTGPLVYPAAHVYCYWALYHVTDQGRKILVAQRLFAVLYLATLAIVLACYRRAKVPIYVLPMLVLSKRLHSIFMLRLFNDCVAVFFLWLAIYYFQRRHWSRACIALSWGLGIKMTLLLSFPAVGTIVFLGQGLFASFKLALLMLVLQIVIALPFLSDNPLGYLGRAFELSRKFKYIWTVNWKFLSEETFLSTKFTVGLLIAHVGILVIFITTRWLKPADRSLKELVGEIIRRKDLSVTLRYKLADRIDSKFILTVILTANAVGFLFARSLHYQFYAYIALATPFLLWRAGFHPAFQYALWAMQEWAWNVYPSTKLSSLAVVGVQLVTVLGIWWHTRNDFVDRIDRKSATKRIPKRASDLLSFKDSLTIGSWR